MDSLMSKLTEWLVVNLYYNRHELWVIVINLKTQAHCSKYIPTHPSLGSVSFQYKIVPLLQWLHVKLTKRSQNNCLHINKETKNFV